MVRETLASLKGSVVVILWRWMGHAITEADPTNSAGMTGSQSRTRRHLNFGDKLEEFNLRGIKAKALI